MQLRHDSRDAWYRFPGGAVSCGQTVRLRVRVCRPEPPDAVWVRLWREAAHRVPMHALGAQDGAWCYEAQVPVGGTPALLWYRFEAEAAGACALYGNAADGLGGLGEQGAEASYQITVYDPAFAPPRWLREGVMYQIFVDRFCNGDPTGALLRARSGIVRHADWYEPPCLALEPSGDNRADDFFGGNLQGIQCKLPYLAGLGVTVLYLNPIFRARSNHKYDTGDYETIDPMFGTEADFTALCEAAARHGIRVMLDGVFSHVGDDSRYFDRYGTYGGTGAFHRQDSPYAPWFTFRHWPDDYACWWGFPTLPEVNELAPGYMAYMLTDENAIVPRWLRAGASAWRLDVADELPMPFLRVLRKAVKAAKPDAVVLGEVWEDASNKVAYDALRSYVLGDTLDSAMNYPLRDVLIAFLLGECPAAQAKRRLDALAENYPRPFLYALMNLLGSHDRARVLNVLCGQSGEALPRAARGALRLTKAQRAQGCRRVRLMLRLIAAMPGIPCVYYGDEAGMEGAADPYCRAAYPWGREDEAQVAFFGTLLRGRHALPVLTCGAFALLAPQEDVLVVVRDAAEGRDAFGEAIPAQVALCAVNRSARARCVRIPAAQVGCDALTDEGGRTLRAAEGVFTLSLPPEEGALWLWTREADTESTPDNP